MNLPNFLTILRIMFSPVFLYYIMIDRTDMALIVFMFVAVTDLADGWIARSTNQVTQFGKAIDPVADKFMIFLALTGIIIKFNFPIWALPLFISRDIASSICSIVIYSKYRIVQDPSKLGKLTTMLQIATILAFIINLRFEIAILWITMVISMISAVEYVIITKRKAYGEF